MRYYLKDGKQAYALLNPISEYEEIENKEQYKECTEKEWNALTPATPAVNAEKTAIKKQIADCKAELRTLDIKTFKFIDGALTADEYEQFKQRKAELRAEINRLEATLNEKD